MTLPFKFGQLHGHVPIAPPVAAAAAQLAHAHFKEQEAQEFSGDDVEVFTIPKWAPELQAWWPKKELEGMGLKLRETPNDFGGIASQDVVVTFGVAQHIDAFHGPVVCYVLHNDGLTFRQGTKGFVPVAGDWFVFNDRANHGVKEGKGEAVFVGWIVPLEFL